MQLIERHIWFIIAIVEKKPVDFMWFIEQNFKLIIKLIVIPWW